MAAVDLAKQVGTTKGDLYVYNGSTLVRLGVGSDDQVLTADAAQPSGVKWAAGGGGGSAGLVEIETQVLGADASEITFDSIPSTYTDLVLRLRLRSSRPSQTNDRMFARVGNGTVDSGGSAYRYRADRFGGQTGGAASSGDSKLIVDNYTLAASTAPADIFSVYEITFLDYAAAFAKMIQGQSRFVGGSDMDRHGLFGGAWTNTADAIDIITLYPESGPDFIAGSRASLYGVV